MIYDDVWTFTSMDTIIGSSTFYIWGLKFIHQSYNIHTCFPIIAGNEWNSNFNVSQKEY